MRWFADEQGLHLVVADNGEGIAPQHVPRLTERFYRVNRDRSRSSGGTGLGSVSYTPLAVYKRQIETLVQPENAQHQDIKIRDKAQVDRNQAEQKYSTARDGLSAAQTALDQIIAAIKVATDRCICLLYTSRCV